MSEVKTTLVTNAVENLPVLEEVPEGATLIAEVDGAFCRVKGEGVGGGDDVDAIIEVKGNHYVSDVNEFDDTTEFTLIKGDARSLMAKVKAGIMPKVILCGSYFYGEDLAYEWVRAAVSFSNFYGNSAEGSVICGFLADRVNDDIIGEASIELHLDGRIVATTMG